MTGTSTSQAISTKLQRIAELARGAPDMVIRTLAHHIDLEFLREAYRLTRKDGAPGVDNQTGAEYAEHLEENLQALLDRFKSGRYRAPPVRRIHIPKGDGRTRPLGLPTFEDKVLQRAVTMVLNAVYEQDFLDCSYGFRPGRSAHAAVQDLWHTLMGMGGGWVIDLDIQGFFDTLDHGHLRNFLDQRVRDGVIRRTLGKWLKAGVMEDDAVRRLKSGTPQGGVISPLLANVYLHHVLDLWFEQDVKPRMSGRVKMIRYADDAVLVFAREDDARRVMAVLAKRLGKFGLQLHPDKTQLIHFTPSSGEKGPERRSFDFLGFTHHWGVSRRGRPVVKRVTSARSLRRSLVAVNQWCRRYRHLPISDQAQRLRQKLHGHYGYFGLTGNFPRLMRFYRVVIGRWRYWLSRRSQRSYVPWARMQGVLRRYPLPIPRVRHSIYRFAANP